MWDKNKAEELTNKGLKSKNELTKKLAEYLVYALDSIKYYENLIDEQNNIIDELIKEGEQND